MLRKINYSPITDERLLQTENLTLTIEDRTVQQSIINILFLIKNNMSANESLASSMLSYLEHFLDENHKGDLQKYDINNQLYIAKNIMEDPSNENINNSANLIPEIENNHPLCQVWKKLILAAISVNIELERSDIYTKKINQMRKYFNFVNLHIKNELLNNAALEFLNTLLEEKLLRNNSLYKQMFQDALEFIKSICDTPLSKNDPANYSLVNVFSHMKNIITDLTPNNVEKNSDRASETMNNLRSFRFSSAWFAFVTTALIATTAASVFTFGIAPAFALATGIVVLAALALSTVGFGHSMYCLYSAKKNHDRFREANSKLTNFQGHANSR